MKLERFSCRIYGVLRRKGKVLLTRSRFQGSTFVNFPGGGVELGEAPAAALKREFQEETGLTPSLLRTLYVSESAHLSTVKPWQLVSLYWLVDADGEPRMGGNNDDVVKLFWADERSIPTGEMFPSDKEFVPKLRQLLS